MKVSELQQYLGDLSRWLESSGAKAIASELATVQDGLAPYRELTLRSFADMLIRTHQANESGNEAGSTTGTKRTPKATPKVAQSVDAISEAIRNLYERVGTSPLTLEQLESELRPLDDLSKAGLVKVAEAIDLKGMNSKNKNDIASAIRNRVKARRGAAQRTEMIHPPTTDFGTGSATPQTGVNSSTDAHE